MASLTSILKNITFTEKYPEDYNYGFSPDIFHRHEHLILQGKDYLSFYILNTNKKNIAGHIFFHLAGESALSPSKATYGGLEFSGRLDLRVLWEFEKYFTARLREKGIMSLTISLPPAIFNLSNHAKLVDLFLFNNYKITKSEIASTILISEKNFTEIVSVDVKRRLKKAEVNFVVRHEGLGMLNKYYEFILKEREEKNYSLSMSLQQLKTTSEALSDDFFLFGLYEKEKLIAASIAIRISKDILYNFYSAHTTAYDKLSPVAYLFHEMYQYCQKNSFKMLDLGTSALDDGPNFSLLHFKEHLGAALSSKLTFTKKLQ